ncbi:MAG TPA: VTT domain-containing protein [Bacilli bacterium]|nr:VTT domain-containing protein [Bacilli bacterium]
MLDKLQIYLQIIVDYLLQVGLVGGFLLIVLESIIPALPLSVFIGLNIITFGKILGYVISYFGTIVGCMLSFITFRYILKNYLYKIFKEKTRIKIEDLMKKMTNIDFNTLVVIIAIPFTPAFLVNIAAGLSNIPIKKYIFALLIGKPFMIYFWGYIGANLLESLKNPIILVKIIVIVLLAYLISKVVEKIINVEKN